MTLKRLLVSLDSKTVAWALYDFANTSYMVLIVTLGFAIYFTEVVVGGSIGLRDFYWGLAVSLSMGIVAASSPILGAIIDVAGWKMRIMFLFTASCVVFTAALALFGRGQIVPSMVCFVIANVGYQASSVFYDSILPEISSPENVGRVSGFGFALGYLGAFFAVGFSYPVFHLAERSGDAGLLKYSFPICSAFFVIFALPLFLKIKDPPRSHEISFLAAARHGFKTVIKTARSARRNLNVFFFLVAFFLYSSAMVVLTFFVGVYGRGTVGLKLTELGLYFVLGQIPAIAGSLLFGFLTDKLGAKKNLMLTLALWLFIVCFAIFARSGWQFLVVAALAGLAAPSTYSSSRSLMSLLAPASQRAEFFGLYGLCAKASSISGPLCFGLASFILQSQRLAMLSVLVFILMGMSVLTLVKVPRAR